MAEVDSEIYAVADTEAQTEFYDKVGRFSSKAYKQLKPTLRKMKQFAGPQSEQILGMTPMGQMLGLGPPGSIEALK